MPVCFQAASMVLETLSPYSAFLSPVPEAIISHSPSLKQLEQSRKWTPYILLKG